jgi:hypothetical protein
MVGESSNTPAEAGSPRQHETVGPRNQPISSPDSAGDPRRNPQLDNELRNETTERPADLRWRTEPPRASDRPARSPADRDC